MKYDFDLDLVHNNSLLLILQQVKPNSVVLEFGPANGRLTRYLKEELNCEVYLVEIDEEAGKEALRYGKDLVIGDIEEYEWLKKYRKIKFDYLIFADVLEHLRNPQEVLLQSKLLLKESGSVLLSVPNLAHNSVIIDLLNDRFNYSEIGLLDNTHIHFFTKESLENMLTAVGLFPCKRMSANVPVGKNEFNNTTDSVSGIDSSFWNTRKYGEVYQYIYEAKKDSSFAEVLQNDIIPNSSRDYLQFFMGGDVYTEERSCKYAINNGENATQVFEHSFSGEMNEIRIDPANSSCIIRVHEVNAYLKGQNVEIKLKTQNAEFYANNFYVFLTEDPMLVYETSNGDKLDSIRIVVEYITIDQGQIRKSVGSVLEAVNRQLVENRRQNAEYENQLNGYEVQLKKVNAEYEEQLKEAHAEYEKQLGEKSACETELEEQKKETEELLNQIARMEEEKKQLLVQLYSANDLINEKDKMLQKILNSKSWKITKILRKS